MKTVAQIIDYVDSMVPNNVATTNKYVYLSEIVQDIKEHNMNYDTWDTNTSTNVNIYALPSSDITWKDLLWIGISQSTYDVAVSQSTCPFSDYDEYKYKGMNESEESMRWVEHGSSQIYLYGLSTADKYWIKAKYLPPLKFGFATSDSTTLLNMTDDMNNYAQQKLAARILRSGSFPRIDLSNNYEMEAQELLGDIKKDKKDLERRMADVKIGYKDWW